MKIRYDEQGLAPAIAQDATTGAVLMLAWMNAEALAQTLATREAYFYSRSRQALWRKGETSGNVLRVREVRIDCDEDAILLLVEPAGPACHTGKPSCFYRVAQESAQLPAASRQPDVSMDQPPDPAGSWKLEAGSLREDGGPLGPPAVILERLGRVIEARRTVSGDASYTRSLLDAGMSRILAKLAEEHGELAAELPSGPEEKVIHEAADVLYHLWVALASRGIPPGGVFAELERRFGTSGHEEKAARRK
jgi:phosphoribosyl-ATP pyrophosphohydrolase/phosphoribosyl-AMP cyclohydrolase